MATAWASGGVRRVKDGETELAFDATCEDPRGGAVRWDASTE
jgi:hypothetical protein